MISSALILHTVLTFEIDRVLASILVAGCILLYLQLLGLYLGSTYLVALRGMPRQAYRDMIRVKGAELIRTRTVRGIP